MDKNFRRIWIGNGRGGKAWHPVEIPVLTTVLENGATAISIMTLSIKGLYVTLSISGTQHNQHSA